MGELLRDAIHIQPIVFVPCNERRECHWAELLILREYLRRTPRFAFVERASTTPGATVYDVMDGASINSLGRTTGYGTGKKVGELFWDNVVNQAWSFNLQDNQPYIAAGSADAQDISTFAANLAAPAGVTTVQPSNTPSTRFSFSAVTRRSGSPVLQYLVSDGPTQSFKCRADHLGRSV